MPSAPPRTAVTVTGDPASAGVMNDVLSALGFGVIEVQRGEQVLDALRLEAPHLVVFDGDLPEMSALAFLRLARPLLGARKVPVILARDGGAALTASEGSDLVEVVLDRPIAPADLREAVTIANWASDRSHEARTSGALRRSRAMSGGHARTSGGHARTSSAQARTSGGHAPPRQRPPSGGETSEKTESYTSSAELQPERPKRRQGVKSANVRAPSAAKRFKSTLAFQPNQQQTVQTGPLPEPAVPTSRGSRKNVPTDTQREVAVPAGRRGERPTVPSGRPGMMDTQKDAAPAAVREQIAPAEPTQEAAEASRRGARPTVIAPTRKRRRKRSKGLPEGTLIDDRYVVRALLGSGGMADVYRVHDRELEEDVALKLLKEDRTDAETQQRFRQEMRICRRLNHPAIVRTFEFGVWEGRRFLTMEVLEGDDMAKVVARRRGPIEEDVALRLFIQVCHGLEAAHQVGVIHRDVKPHNIFVVDGDQHARLMDFGIAKSQDFTTTADAGMSVLGTPAYLAPERLKDDEELTPKTDLYSVGASMYHVLTNKLPFDAPSIQKLLTAILMRPPTPLREHNPDVSPELEDVILSTMRKDPSSRPASCADLAAQLGAIASRGRHGR